MNISWLFGGVLALIWGFAFAWYLWQTDHGQWLFVRHTWVATSIGIGVDLLILFPLIPLYDWLVVVVVIALSSVGIVVASLATGHQADQRIIDGQSRE